MLCPYILKRTIQKTIIQHDEDMQETGSIIIQYQEMMKCTDKCMKYKDGKCIYKE